MARTFDNTDDNIAIAPQSALNNLATFSASAVVRLNTNHTVEYQLFDKQGTDFLGRLFLFQPNFGGRQNTIGSFISHDGSGSIRNAAFSATNALTLNQWTVIVSTWAGTGNAPKLYLCPVGGTLAEATYFSQETTGTTADSDATASLRVGTRDPLDQFADMDICEVGLWNRVLTSAELALLGKGYVPRFITQGLLYYGAITGQNTPEPLLVNGVWTVGTMTGTTKVTGPDGLKYPPGNSVITTYNSRNLGYS